MSCYLDLIKQYVKSTKKYTQHHVLVLLFYRRYFWPSQSPLHLNSHEDLHAVFQDRNDMCVDRCRTTKYHKVLQYSKWRLSAPKPTFFGSGGGYKVGNAWKWIEKDLLCFCRPSPAEIRDFSGHLESTNPELFNCRSKLNHLGPKLTRFDQNLRDQEASLSIPADPE